MENAVPVQNRTLADHVLDMRSRFAEKGDPLPLSEVLVPEFEEGAHPKHSFKRLIRWPILC
jgi:hypothetical protein